MTAHVTTALYTINGHEFEENAAMTLSSYIIWEKLFLFRTDKLGGKKTLKIQKKQDAFQTISILFLKQKPSQWSESTSYDTLPNDIKIV